MLLAYLEYESKIMHTIDQWHWNHEDFGESRSDVYRGFTAGHNADSVSRIECQGVHDVSV